MDQACFEKASLSKGLNFLKSKRGVSLHIKRLKDWSLITRQQREDHHSCRAASKSQPIKNKCIDLIKRCCIMPKKCGKRLMPQKKPYCTIWSEDAAKKTRQDGNWAVPKLDIQGTCTLTSPQHGRSCSGWGLTEVGEHLSSLDVQRNTGTCRKLLKD